MSFILLVPKLQLGNPSWCKALLCAKTGTPGGDIPFAKLELGAHMRPQAGAWGREETATSGTKIQLMVHGLEAGATILLIKELWWGVPILHDFLPLSIIGLG